VRPTRQFPARNAARETGAKTTMRSPPGSERMRRSTIRCRTRPPIPVPAPTVVTAIKAQQNAPARRHNSSLEASICRSVPRGDQEETSGERQMKTSGNAKPSRDEKLGAAAANATRVRARSTRWPPNPYPAARRAALPEVRFVTEDGGPPASSISRYPSEQGENRLGPGTPQTTRI